MAHTPWRGSIGRRVPGSGPRDARVVLLAEAPGETEEERGVPLVGRSGTLLFDGERGIDPVVWPGLARLGLGRDVVRCENVLEVRPLGNDLDTVSLASMEKWRRDCAERLAGLTSMELLVPMGNCALNAALATPLKQRKRQGSNARSWAWPHTITAWRGSVNRVEIGGRPVTMIPTFHPATFLYGSGSNFQAWRADWARIARAAVEDIETDPKMLHLVGPTWAQVETFERLVQHVWHRQGDDALLAFDIETIGPIIDCIGFCVDGATTLTLPLLPQLWAGGKADVRRAWGVVERLMTHAIPKGTHWGYYDVYRIERQKGWRVRKWWWDSYNLHHLLDPADEHRLSYCASRDLAVPFWKHESKEDKKGVSKELKSNWQRRHAYCGKDTGYTWHLIRRYVGRLRGRWKPTWAMIA